MANRRMLDGSFWDDKAIHKRLSRTARYLFIALISHADDEGRVDADPAFLKARVFLYDDDVSQGDVQTALEEIATVCGSFCLYEHEGEQFAAFLKWEQYQSIKNSRGSSLPIPPAAPIPTTSKPGPKRKLHAQADNESIGSNSIANPAQSLSGAMETELQSNSVETGTNARAEVKGNEIEEKRREERTAAPSASDWKATYREAVNLNLARPVEVAHGDAFAAEHERLGADEFKRRLVWWLSVGGGPKNAEKQLEVLRRGVEAMKARPATGTNGAKPNPFKGAV